MVAPAVLAVTEQVLPTWAGAVIAFSAVLTAFGVFWRLVLKPGFRLARLLSDLNPLLVNVVEAMHDTSQPFTVLDEIVHQFRTNSGSSLRDVIDRLEAASKLSTDALALVAATLKANTAITDDDRVRLARLTNDIAELTSWRKDRQAEAIHERAAADVVLETEKARQRAARLVLDTEDARQDAADLVRSTDKAREVAADKVLRDDDK